MDKKSMLQEMLASRYLVNIGVQKLRNIPKFERLYFKLQWVFMLFLIMNGVLITQLDIMGKLIAMLLYPLFYLLWLHLLSALIEFTAKIIESPKQEVNKND